MPVPSLTVEDGFTPKGKRHRRTANLMLKKTQQ